MYQGFIVQLVEDHTGKGNKGGFVRSWGSVSMPGTLSLTDLRVHYWVSTVPT